MMNPTFSSKMMFGGYHESYYHPDQLLLLGSQADSINGRGTICLSVGRREAGRDPNELASQHIMTM